MKRVYRYRSSDNVVVGFFETTDAYALQANEFESKAIEKDIIEDRVGKFLYDPMTGAVSNRPQVDIDAELAALAKAGIREVFQLRSPDGSAWDVKIDNGGNLTRAKA